MPNFSVMPYCVTMARAILVAFSMSLEAPLVASPKMSSSAARPPQSVAIWFSMSPLVSR